MQRLRAYILGGAFALANAASAHAAPVFFSAGEHDAYSRVVLSPGGKDAAISRNGRLVTILLPTPVGEVNIDQLVDRQRAHRVARASLTPSVSGSIVTLELTCDCTLKQSRLSNGKTVLDIVGAKDGSSVSAAPVKPQAAPTSVKPADVAAAAPPTPKPAKEPAVKPGAPAPAPNTTEVQTDDLSVEKARERMLELLTQAADEGLINLRADDNAPTTAASGGPTPLTPASLPTMPGVDGQLMTRSINEPMDLPTDRTKEKTAAAAAPTRSCLTDDAFALPGDKFDKDPLGAISDLQSNLAFSDGETQRRIAEDLAAGFLSIGFGEEALKVLAEHGHTDSLQAEMARAVANLPMDGAGRIMGARDCDGAHALWQALAGEATEAVGPAARSGDAVDGMPKRLRRLAAARIAKKMVDAGAWRQAERFFEIATDGLDALSPDLALVDAKLKENAGRAEDAEDVLLEVAASNTDASTEAFLELAERYADGETPHEGFLDDIGTVAKTRRGTPEGERAAILEGVGYADAGHIEAAVLILRHSAETGDAPQEDARAEARRLIERSMARKDDAKKVSALTAYLDNRAFLDGGADDPAFRKTVAAAAMALGLPNVAFKIFEESGADDPDAARLKSEAALRA
ncbi:MAG: hypothetical protein AAGC56_05850, partial [Pseudomonadota bacterium]